MNTFLNELKTQDNVTLTDNGATAYKSTLDNVYDMFAFAGAYRNKSEDDCKLLFKKAYEENQTLALRCLFYVGDIRGGQGERRFFRAAFNWLCTEYPRRASALIPNIPEYRRWDDVLYATHGTAVFKRAAKFVKNQLNLDMVSSTPSLCAKWVPSENASSLKTKKIASELRNIFGWSHKQYRKVLSTLRKKINIVERLMSENRWDEIEFDKIPSKAGIIYRNAFARRDIIAQKYEKFAMDKSTKVNAATLYPYDVVKNALDLYFNHFYCTMESEIDRTQRAIVNKYWENLPDYLNGKKCSMMCVVDTSGSMTSSYGCSTRPIDVAISLGMYCAERIGGPFKNHYISFSSRPKLVEVEGIDFVDKVKRIYNNCIIEDTNLEKVFELILDMAKRPNVNPDDVPETIVVISDMQINSGVSGNWRYGDIESHMDAMDRRFRMNGVRMPKLVYWNVNASNPVILQKPSSRVSYVSGCSPVIFEQVLKGVSGIELMLDKLNSDRYKAIV